MVQIRSRRFFALTLAVVGAVCVLLAAGVALTMRPSQVDDLKRELSERIVSGATREEVGAILSSKGITYSEYDAPQRIKAIVHEDGGFMVTKSLSITVEFRAGRASDIRIETAYTGP